MASLTHQRLLEVLDYEPLTGIFTWKMPTGYRAKAGTEAGSVMANGYRHIRIEGRYYYSHRLAWFWVYGEWPRGAIDHIDGVRLNNAIANLREASNAQNSWNRGKQGDNKSGYKGVSWSSVMGKWWAQIKRNGRHYNLGYHDCPKEAAEAYAAAAKRLHGEFANTGAAP